MAMLVLLLIKAAASRFAPGQEYTITQISPACLFLNLRLPAYD
jgi:hypothetical protein